jgi:hypothetical protein
MAGKTGNFPPFATDPGDQLNRKFLEIVQKLLFLVFFLALLKSFSSPGARRRAG